MHGNTFNYIEIKTILYTNVIWKYYICVTEGQAAPVDTIPIVGAVDIMTGEGASTGVSSGVTTSETSVSSFQDTVPGFPGVDSSVNPGGVPSKSWR
jgi:hypothetical protein